MQFCDAHHTSSTEQQQKAVSSQSSAQRGTQPKQALQNKSSLYRGSSRKPNNFTIKKTSVEQAKNERIFDPIDYPAMTVKSPATKATSSSQNSTPVDTGIASRPTTSAPVAEISSSRVVDAESVHDHEDASQARLHSDERSPDALSTISDHAPVEDFKHSTLMTEFAFATADSKQDQMISSGPGYNPIPDEEHDGSKQTQIPPAECSIGKTSFPRSEGALQVDLQISPAHESTASEDSSHRSSQDHCAVSPMPL